MPSCRPSVRPSVHPSIRSMIVCLYVCSVGRDIRHRKTEHAWERERERKKRKPLAAFLSLRGLEKDFPCFSVRVPLVDGGAELARFAPLRSLYEVLDLRLLQRILEEEEEERLSQQQQEEGRKKRR